MMYIYSTCMSYDVRKRNVRNDVCVPLRRVAVDWRQRGRSANLSRHQQRSKKCIRSERVAMGISADP